MDLFYQDLSENGIKASDLDFYSLLRRQAHEGYIFFNQRRAVIVDMEAIGELRRQLIETVGRETAQGILTRFGYSQGSNDAQRLYEAFDWETESDWLVAGLTLQSLAGAVHIDSPKMAFDRENGHFNMQGVWSNSHEAEEHLNLYGQSDHPVCWTLTGYASGYASQFFGQELLAIETECVGQGDDHCAWEIRPIDQWGKSAESNLRALQPVKFGERPKANGQLQEQTRRLSLLNEMAVELNLASNVDEVYRVAVSKTKQIVETDQVNIALLDPDGEKVRLFALDESGILTLNSELPFDLTTGIGRAVTSRQVVTTNDLQAGGSEENRQLAEQSFHSTIVAPLISSGKVVGTLNVETKVPNALDDSNQNMMTQTASLLATAIESQQRAAELEETTTFLDSIIENIPTMVFVKSAEDLRFVRFNKAGEKLVGVDREAMLGKNDYDFFPKEEADFFAAKDRDVLNNGVMLDIPEEPIQTVHQGTRYLHTQKVPILDPAGEPKYLLGISEDITERLQVGQSLRKSEDRYRSLYARTPAMLHSIDADSRIIEVSDYWLEVLDYERDEVIGRSLLDFLTEESRLEAQTTMLPNLKSSGFSRDVSYQFVKKNGEIIDILLSAIVERDEMDEFSQALAVLNDVTERLKTEQSLAKRAAELETVAEVSAVVSTVLDMEQLLQTVVDLTKNRFGLYQVLIVLLDDRNNTLAVAAGSGEVGHQLAEENLVLSVTQEQSLVAQAARTRKPVLVNDTYEAPGFLPHRLLPDTRSEMVIPLIVGERLIGVMDLQAIRVDHFTPEDLRIQTALATQVAVAVENARLFEAQHQAAARTEQQAQRLVLLNEMGTELSQVTTVDQVYKVVAAKANQIFSANRSSVALVNPSGDDYELFGLDVIKGAILLGSLLPLQGSAIGKAVTENQVIVIPDLRESRFTNHAQLASRAPRSMMVAPLITSGQIVGSLNVGSTHPNAYDEQDAALALQIASLLASNIESRRLFEQIEAALAETEVLYSVLQEISRQRDMEPLLQTVYKQVQRVIPTDAFFVGLYDQASQSMSYPLVYNGDQRNLNPPSAVLTDKNVEQVIKDGQPLVVNRTPSEMEAFRLDSGQSHSPGGKPEAALLLVPLRIGEQITGVMSVQSYRLNVYDERDVVLLGGIANQVSVAIENVRLYKEAQNRADRERILREITAQVRNSVDVDTIMRTAAQEVGQALGRAAFVHLNNGDDK